MKSKKLSLKKETLAELTNEELAQVAGGALTSDSCFGVCPTSSSTPSCYAACPTPSNPLYSCPTLNSKCHLAFDGPDLTAK